MSEVLKAKKLLLVLSTSKTSDEAVEYAVAHAQKEGLGLVALYIIEQGLIDELFDRFTDIGFIGDKPSTELIEAVMKEYRQRGYEEVGRVQVRAMEENIDFDAVSGQGDFVENILQVISSHDVSTAVIVRRKGSAFLRYSSRSIRAQSRIDELKEKAPCEVTVFEEK